MSQATLFKITIIGTGGHGSEPQRCKIAVHKAVNFYQKFQQFLKELKQKTGKDFVCTLPVFHSGQRFNVISQTARLEGTLRSFDQDITYAVLGKINQLLEQIKNEGFSVTFETQTVAMNANSKAESDNVIRVAKEVLGEDRVSSGTLPFRASEDFGFYTIQKPGAFFFFCTKVKEEEVFLHNPRFNFKDELIEIAANFWHKLALDRLTSE